MRSLNQVTLIGNVGGDPEIRTLANGARVATFSLATTRTWTGKDGPQQEKTEWHRLVVWSSLAATFGFVEKFVSKGDRLYVEGQLEYRSYVAKDGSTRYTTEIRVMEVIDVSRSRTGEGANGDTDAPSPSAMAGVGAGAELDFQGPLADDGDDLPF